MAERIESIDVAKGIAIISIVVGHLGFIGPGGVNVLFRIVFQYHVPLFFIIAGYFLSTKVEFKQFIKQKMTRLIAPYASTCLAMLIVLLFWKYVARTMEPIPFTGIKQFLVAALYGAGSNAAALPEGVVQIGPIWFLEALLIALVEVRLSLKLGKFAWIPIVILFLVAEVTSGLIWLPFNIQSGLIAGFYLYCGQFFRKHNAFTTPKSIALFASLVVSAILAFYANIWASIATAYLGPFWLGLPLSISSSLLIIMISEGIARRCKTAKRFLAFYGKNSLAVLCMHVVLLNGGLEWAVAHIGIPVDFNIRFMVLVLVHLAACALFAILTKRSNILSRLFIGG